MQLGLTILLSCPHQFQNFKHSQSVFGWKQMTETIRERHLVTQWKEGKMKLFWKTTRTSASRSRTKVRGEYHGKPKTKMYSKSLRPSFLVTCSWIILFNVYYNLLPSEILVTGRRTEWKMKAYQRKFWTINNSFSIVNAFQEFISTK